VARVEGFEPAQIGQEPIDFNGDPVAVGARGDSRTGVGVFGASGALPPDVDDIPTNIAGVEGHSIQIPGVFGLSVEDAGVRGGSLQGLGVLGRSSTVPVSRASPSRRARQGEPPSAAGVFSCSSAGRNGVTGFAGGAVGFSGGPWHP
jgi:hypothetical protein